MQTQKIRATVLGATGMVGQRFAQLLEGHPWFEVTALVGSERSAGRPYGKACRWVRVINPVAHGRSIADRIEGFRKTVDGTRPRL